MKQIVIFDFNRTLYNPDSRHLITGVKHILKTVEKRGYLLYLISRAEKSRRATIQNSGIGKFFRDITICRQKNPAVFKKIIRKTTASVPASFVIGDRVKEEITIGNKLGFKTVWFQNGKFRNELPKNKMERPDFIVKKLKEILKIIP